MNHESYNLSLICCMYIYICVCVCTYQENSPGAKTLSSWKHLLPPCHVKRPSWLQRWRSADVSVRVGSPWDPPLSVARPLCRQFPLRAPLPSGLTRTRRSFAPSKPMRDPVSLGRSSPASWANRSTMSRLCGTTLRIEWDDLFHHVSLLSKLRRYSTTGRKKGAQLVNHHFSP